MPTQSADQSTPLDHGKIRYAVVGLGYIAQSAVLPAFAKASLNSELVALVSGDPEKLRTLGRKYGVRQLFGYEDLDQALAVVDAIYIALPNTLHRAYTEAAAAAGVHVLCEKPMAMTEKDCRAMIDRCDEADVKLMIGYRLHFEKANLEAMKLVGEGGLGEPRIFTAAFAQDVEAGNLRLKEGEGGPLFDIGIYCLNAARSVFRAEPLEVFAFEARRKDPRFSSSPEMLNAVLRFPGERLATFTCSFGAAHRSWYEIVGTEGTLRVDPAYGIGEDLVHHLTQKERERTHVFKARDQFAAELLYFSSCLLDNEDPEPSGEEGFADVRVLRAIEASVRGQAPVSLQPFDRSRRPTPRQEIQRPPTRKPDLVNAKGPSSGH